LKATSRELEDRKFVTKKDPWAKVMGGLEERGIFARLKKNFKSATELIASDIELRVDLAVARLDSEFHPIDTQRLSSLLAERKSLDTPWTAAVEQIEERIGNNCLLMEKS
jgi:hypothetical protein